MAKREQLLKQIGNSYQGIRTYGDSMTRMAEDLPLDREDLIQIIADSLQAACDRLVEGFKDVPQLDDVLDDPIKAPISDTEAFRYITILTLARQTHTDNMWTVAQYLKRYSLDYQVLFYREATKREPRIKQTSAFVEWANAHNIDEIGKIADELHKNEIRKGAQ